MHSNFKGDTEHSTLSGIYDFSLNIPVNPTTNINLSLPFIVMNYEYHYHFYDIEFHHSYEENGIGNLYLGVQINPRDSVKKSSGLIASVGIFLPTISEDKYLLFFQGLYTDLHRMQKYIPNTLTIFGNVSCHKKEPNGFMYGFELEPNMFIPTKGENREGELYLHYGLTGGMQQTNLAITAELLGIVILTEDVDDFSDRFSHALVFGLQWTKGRIKPGIFYKIYMEEAQSEVISGVLGIKLTALLR
jgi:hypothetical protein